MAKTTVRKSGVKRQKYIYWNIEETSSIFSIHCIVSQFQGGKKRNWDWEHIFEVTAEWKIFWDNRVSKDPVCVSQSHGQSEGVGCFILSSCLFVSLLFCLFIKKIVFVCFSGSPSHLLLEDTCKLGNPTSWQLFCFVVLSFCRFVIPNLFVRS